MPTKTTTYLSRMQDAIDRIFAICGPHLRMATPLGLGKPNVLLNKIYQYVADRPDHSLELYTALSLQPPTLGTGLARRFLEPFRHRHWGVDYPELAYARDAKADRLPHNIRVHEFYLQAGSALGSETLQRDYQSINYTHVAENLVRSNVRVAIQLIAQKPDGLKSAYSLSCNPDLTRDVIDLCQQQGKPLYLVGVVHPDLPFLGGDAQVDADFFDIIVEDPAARHTLFALPRMPVTLAEHAIGFHASRLVKDGGTLQIGIGALSDALVAALLMRHQHSPDYIALCHLVAKAGDSSFSDDAEESSNRYQAASASLALESAPFEIGLYGLSEMVMDGFMHLRKAGILKREIIDERTGSKTFLHGAFALGSKPFYEWLQTLSAADFDGIRMTRVSRVNDLYDANELALRAQRTKPRFFNTCMQVTLLGGVASETLADGRVVSGVGGQYNFVAMSHELPESRSVMMLRSTRKDKGRLTSNIVWSHGHLTIPRHLRDIVVTEYGIADLRGKTDEETIKALLNVTDSEFQEELASVAKLHGKLAKNYQIPAWAKRNTPEHLGLFIKAGRDRGCFMNYPFGSDFTPEEERLAAALSNMQDRFTGSVAKRLWRAAKDIKSSIGVEGRNFDQELARMQLKNPGSFKERILKHLLLAALTRLQ